MTEMATRLTRLGARRLFALETALLAVLSYLPFLLSLRGRVSADTKQYLYLDPGELLAHAPYLWDPDVAAGTVPHQGIGYLFPMGPWFWAFDAVGVPDWVAQRLWLGTISFAAALGARWLLRALGAGPVGALAGALVYLWTPYQLAFTARISILLLAWAGLPWLIGLTMRAVRRGGWRDPALFALVVLTVGSVNASTLLFALIAPALWLVLELCTGGRAALRPVAAATARISLLTLGVSAWWLAGLRLQGAYGLPVLHLTESLSWVAQASRPDDVLRGLGNWFFYGEDMGGRAVDQALDYLVGGRVSMASYAVPVVALAAAALIRWRHRTFALLLVVVGTVVAVGSWPYDDLTPYGRVWKAFTQDFAVGLALRNSPRVVPLVVLGLAALLAAGITAQPTARRRGITGFVVVLLAVGAIGPVWRTGFLSERQARPEDVPTYWREAAAAMEREGDRTRVLEIPGANFAGYRWGNAIEPITPGLMDRPYLAREVLPYGSPPSVNLLDALDRRFQSDTFEPASLAPLARLFAAGTVALRADLEANRFDSAPPEEIWDQLTAPRAPGLEPPRGFGPPIGADGGPPSVALFDVDDPVEIVHTRPVDGPVVLAGDGDGIVDAAAAGLVDGRSLVLPLAALADRELDEAMADGAALVLTDSNRRRPQHWFFSVRRNKGPTERAGSTTPDPSGYDYRLEVFPGSGDDDRTVVEQIGGRVDATADGGPARPEDRGVYAFDGDLRTSWRVGGRDPRGESVVLEADRPVRTDHIVVVQPQEGPRDRVLTRVRLRLDDGAPVSVDLGPESLRPPGQRIPFPEQSVRRVELELVDTTTPPFDPRLANAVGFAEVRVGDVRVSETVRVPIDLAERVDGATADHGLDVVLTRLRVDPLDRTRQDEELRLDRRVVLPDDRTFRIGGTVRVNGGAPDEVLDAVLGTTVGGTTFSATSHHHGDAATRASRAFDADQGTAWTTAQGPQEGQAVTVRTAAPATFGAVTVTFLDDVGHSTPARLHIEAEGRRVGEVTIPATTGAPQGTRSVRLDVPRVAAGELRLVVDAVHRRTSVPGDPAPTETLPVALADIRGEGLPRSPADGRIDRSCRTDLLEVDGRPVAVRIGPAAAGAGGGLPLEGCRPLALDGGSHRLRSPMGLDAGIDLDRLVLSSGVGGGPVAIGPRGGGPGGGAEVVDVEEHAATSLDVRVRTDGRPFWLVLGQSANRGWAAESAAVATGPRQLVDGYANGWLVEPDGDGTTTISLRWTPQRLVWGGLLVSAVAVVVCLAIVLAPLLRRRPAGLASASLADPPALDALSTGPWLVPWRAVDAVATLVVGAVATAVSRPWIGVVSAAATAVATVVPPARLAIGLAAPALLVLGRLRDSPELAWLTIGLLVSGIASEASSRWKARRQPPA